MAHVEIWMTWMGTVIPHHVVNPDQLCEEGGCWCSSAHTIAWVVSINCDTEVEETLQDIVRDEICGSVGG